MGNRFFAGPDALSAVRVTENWFILPLIHVPDPQNQTALSLGGNPQRRRLDGHAGRGGLPQQRNLHRRQGVGFVDEVAKGALQGQGFGGEGAGGLESACVSSI